MTPTQIGQRIGERFGQAIRAAWLEDKHPRLDVGVETWRAMAEFLREDTALEFDWLACLTAVDYVAQDELAVVYDLYSTRHDHWFAVKVFMPRGEAHVPSVADIWPAADWHEREAFDMMGIVFDGHPDPRRILLPDDWEGFPLRKDYVFPRQYHGIPGSYETDWQQKPDYPK